MPSDMERPTAEYYRDKAAEIRASARLGKSPEVVRESASIAWQPMRRDGRLTRNGSRHWLFPEKVTFGDPHEP